MKQKRKLWCGTITSRPEMRDHRNAATSVGGHIQPRGCLLLEPKRIFKFCAENFVGEGCSRWRICSRGKVKSQCVVLQRVRGEQYANAVGSVV